jgi:hypothetical protein
MTTNLAVIAVSVGALALSGCKSTIDQDVNSGKDYRSKGAKEIKLEGGEGRSSRDVVTYPGGDRVDWKVFEIPEGSSGDLEIRVKHRPPRPGLDVAFDVYDAYFERIGRAKPKANKRSKRVSIEGVKSGKYYVQVYAPDRGDAGRYRVRVRFKPRGGGGGGPPEPTATEFPDPPSLAAVPDVEPPPEKVPCPDDPTRFQPDCPAPKVPCADDPTRFEPDCPDNRPKPLTARVVDFKIAPDGVVVVCDKGTKNRVDRGWKGQLLDRSGNPIPGGSFVVTRVTTRQASGKVRLSLDQAKANKGVRLSPP